MINHPECRLSEHLRIRSRQRGLPEALVQALIAYADRAVAVGGGRTSLTLSRDGLAALRAEGLAGVERLGRHAVVIAPDGGAITVLVPSGPSGRRYRRTRNGHARARLASCGRRR